MKQNFKTINDFPDLKQGRSLFYNLALSHFEAGLDPSIILPCKDCYAGQLDYTKTYDYLLSDEPTNHILFYLLHLTLTTIISEKENGATKDYFKKHITSLYKEGRISQPLVNKVALLLISHYYAPDLLEHLIEHKLVDVDMRSKGGYTLLMLVQDSPRIKMLIRLGANVNAVVDNPQSPDHQKTAYDLALASRKKGWIALLKEHVPQSQINSQNEELLRQFLAAPNFKKQIKIFILSLKDSSPSLIEEISLNQEKYKTLIEYRDGNRKDLLSHCISNNNKEMALKVMDLNHYKKNKNVAVAIYDQTHPRFAEPQTLQEECYCSYAMSSSRPGMARLMFEHGFKGDGTLIKYFESMDVYMNVCTPVFNLMLDSNNYDPTLDVRWKNLSHHKLEEKLKTVSALEITDFISNNSFMLKLNKTELYNNGKDILYKSSSSNYRHVSGAHARFFCILFKRLQELSPLEFDPLFNQFLKSLSKAPDKISEYFTLITLSQLPAEKSRIFASLDNSKPFVINLVKQNLEKILEKFEAKEVKKFKI